MSYMPTQGIKDIAASEVETLRAELQQERKAKRSWSAVAFVFGIMVTTGTSLLNTWAVHWWGPPGG